MGGGAETTVWIARTTPLRRRKICRDEAQILRFEAMYMPSISIWDGLPRVIGAMVTLASALQADVFAAWYGRGELTQ